MHSDVVVIGAGVIGLAVARKLAGEGASVVVLEKESQFGSGVSSRNTEVIHAGIYYQTGSLKATLCVKGKRMLYEHCAKYGVRCKLLGKIIIATTKSDAERLPHLRKQAETNGVDDLVDLDASGIKRLEPQLIGVSALFSPSSGIFDTHGFMKSLFKLGIDSGMIFAPLSPVVGAEGSAGKWKVSIGGNEPSTITCKAVINAAGLYAIGLSRKIFSGRQTPELHPIKGSYARYSPRSPINHIVYPALVPGVIEERVDATPDLAGSLRFGPSVDGPRDLDDFSVAPDVVDRMITGLRRYMPHVKKEYVMPDCAGIRPRIYGLKEPVQDFRFEWADGTGWLDLWGMESPGLTASLTIAEHVYDMIKGKNIL